MMWLVALCLIAAIGAGGLAVGFALAAAKVAFWLFLALFLLSFFGTMLAPAPR